MQCPVPGGADSCGVAHANMLSTGACAGQYMVSNGARVVQYTWDKQLETWVKSSVMLGGARKEPTVISPKQYCRRFRVAISSYFVFVPSAEQALPSLDPDALM